MYHKILYEGETSLPVIDYGGGPTCITEFFMMKKQVFQLYSIRDT